MGDVGFGSGVGRIQQLGRDGNFRQWFAHMEAALTMKGWERWLTEEPAEDDDAGVAEDRKARAAIKFDRPDMLVFDTGATHNFVSDLSLVHDKEDTPVDIVTLAGKEEHVVACAGKALLEMENGSTVTLKHVLCVPSMDMNLLSGGYVNSVNGSWEGRRGQLTVRDSDEDVVLTGTLRDGLYYMNCHMVPETSDNRHPAHAYVAKQAELWHRRYSHVGMQNLRRAEKVVTGMGEVKWPADDAKACEICPLAKQPRAHYPRSDSEAEAPLQLVHTDMMEIRVPGLKGERYAVTLLDDYSRYAEVICVRTKDQVAEALVTRLKEWERQLQTPQKPVMWVKIIRSDNGTEFKGELKWWCSKRGIIMQHSVARRPQQNGRAERINRTLSERTRAMLKDAGLPKRLWPQAMDTAAYTRNLVPTEGQNKTPHELFWEKVPDVSHLRVFGSKATEHIPSELRSKLDDVSRDVIFVGYPRHMKAWTVMHKAKGVWKLSDSADVSFREDEKLQQPREPEEALPETEYDELILFDDEAGDEDADHVTLEDSDEWSLSDDDSDAAWDGQGEDPGACADAEGNPDDGSGDDGQDEPMHDDGGGGAAGAGGQRRYPARARNPPNLPYQAQLFVAEGVQTASDEDLLVAPKSYQEAMKRPDREVWVSAKDEEYGSLRGKGVIEECDLPPGQKALPSKGVCDLKFDEKGNLVRHKYRLVAMGNLQQEGEYGDLFAPTAQSATFRLMLALKAADPKLKLRQVDVKTAFLHADLKEVVYVRPPPELRQGNKVWRLRKALYGLKQAPRAWNEELTKAMISDKYTESEHDPCLFIRGTGRDRVYFLVHVDDAAILAAEGEDDKAVADLSKHFEVKDLGELSYFLGQEVAEVKGQGVMLSQGQYAKRMLERQGVRAYTEADFKELGMPREAVMRLYSDADLAGELDGRKSTSGMLMTMNGGPILWASKLQTVVATSTSEAEYISAAMAVKEALWVQCSNACMRLRE
eukprot:jgi/Ulvmu1/1569/UM110_0032.1